MNSLPTPSVEVLTSIEAADTDRIRRLFDHAVPFEQQDDRFDSFPTSDDSTPPAVLAAIASAGDQLTGYLGGPIESGQAELDAIVHPSVEAPDAAVKTMFSALGPTLGGAGAERAQIWGRPAKPWHADVASALGGAQTRALHQMRCRLPVDVPAIESRDYRPDHDLDALREVNNRAFASHPDQGRQTNASLLSTMAQPWFRPDGIRIHERDGRVVGFCWTKIHPPRTRFTQPQEHAQPLGEIFVIGVDPDFHGQGLGAPMTAAGLQWLYEEGLEIGMLYVEADNAPAVKTYERLGFAVVRTDRAWSVPLVQS